MLVKCDLIIRMYFYSCATALRSRKGLPRPLWRYYHSSIWTKRREVIGNCGYRFTDSLTFISRKIRGRRVIWNKRPRLNWYHVSCSYGVTFKFQLGAILKWRIHWGGEEGLTKCRHSKGGCVDLVLWILPKCRQGGRGSKIPKIV